jgi:hypothetical protein
MERQTLRLRGEQTLWRNKHFPDDENEYNWQFHYEQMRLTRRDPPVTKEIINHLLANGVVLGDPNHIDRVKFLDIIDGVRWEIIVAVDDLNPPALLTVFSSEHEQRQ